MSGGGKVCRHRRAHLTKADKTNAGTGLVL
jgi:hypothetical protein